MNVIQDFSDGLKFVKYSLIEIKREIYKGVGIYFLTQLSQVDTLLQVMWKIVNCYFVFSTDFCVFFYCDSKRLLHLI